MSEFSCEFCKSEFKDKSNLQRHIKTSKKCISKRTSTEYAKTVPTETVPTETVPTETVPTETVPTETVPIESADYNRDDLLTKYNKALKQLEEKEKELAYIKEAYIKLSKYKKDDEIRYKVRMICSCGVLRVMEKARLKQILDETGNVIFKVDDDPDRFERDILITMTRMK